MKPISRDDLVFRASFDARRDVLQLPSDASGRLDDKTARRALSGELRQTYLDQVKAGARPNADELVGAYETHLKKQLDGLTGSGRSAKLVSAAEAKKLSGALADAYAVLKQSREAADLRARAAKEPFPKGAVERGLVFETYLVAEGGRTATAVFDGLKVEARLTALGELVAKKGEQVAGDLRALPVKEKGLGFDVGGVKLQLYGSKPTFALSDGRSIVTVSRDDDLVKGEQLVLARFDAKGGEPVASTTYRTGKGGLADLVGRLPKAEQARFGGRAEGPGFASVDRDGLELVANVLGALAGASKTAVKGARQALDGLATTEAQTLASFAVRDGWAGKYAALAERVKKDGELVLGDMDTYVRIADRFTRHDSNDRKVDLVKGRGPLLIVDNHFGGLGHAVPLDALAKGELEVHIFRERQALGVLRTNAAAEPLQVPGPNPLHAVANDLDEYLPAMIAHHDD